MPVDGILNVNKPLGKTSFDMVSLVRRLSGQRQVGHGGTLDPQATGVLPVCLGQGTRVTEFFMGSRKTYRAEIELGKETETYDSVGRVVSVGDASRVTISQMQEALSRFQGEIEQVPPMYSAIKHQGKALYELARAGEHVEVRPRKVHIYRLETLGWEPPVVALEIECGRGTYVRSIAHDLGVALGCGAYLKSLVRVKVGPFLISDALTPEELASASPRGYWQDMLYPLDTPMLDFSAAVLDEGSERSIVRGLSLEAKGAAGEGSLCRAYTCDGRFIALLAFQGAQAAWHPRKVFDTTLGHSGAA